MDFQHLDWASLAAATVVIGAIVVFIKKSAGVLTVKEDLDSHVSLTAPMVRDFPLLKRRIRVVERAVESGERERLDFRSEVLDKLTDVHSEIGELKNLIIKTLAER